MFLFFGPPCINDDDNFNKKYNNKKKVQGHVAKKEITH